MTDNLTKIICANATELAAASRTHGGPDSLLFYLFLGEKLSTTGRSWCGDCVRAEPVIATVFEQFAAQLALDQSPVRVAVAQCSLSREAFRDADCAFRTDPAILLTCVPTLMAAPSTGTEGTLENLVIRRLGDAEAQVPETVAAFLAQFRH